MAAHEDYAQFIIAQALLCIEIQYGLGPGFKRNNQRIGRASENSTPSDRRDRIVMGGAKEPGLRLLWNAFERPGLHRAKHRLLCCIFRELKMCRTKQSRQPDNNPSGLSAE